MLMNLFDFLWLIGSGVAFLCTLTELQNDLDKRIKKGEAKKGEDLPYISVLIFSFLFSWGMVIWLWWVNKPVKKKNCK